MLLGSAQGPLLLGRRAGSRSGAGGASDAGCAGAGAGAGPGAGFDVADCAGSAAAPAFVARALPSARCLRKASNCVGWHLCQSCSG